MTVRVLYLQVRLIIKLNLKLTHHVCIDNLFVVSSDCRFKPQVLISVNTVDSFQGMENDIIIISCVRYNPNNFLQSEQRLNVALTRAKQALYIVGNYTLFKVSPLHFLFHFS